MAGRFVELDWRPTAMGELALRRRHDPVLGDEVFEVLLGEEYLMSSAFTHGEVQLARLGLDGVDGDALDVVVGGLGLGYTAAAALEDARVATLHVVEAHDAVLDWHRRQLLPVSPTLTEDPRCSFVHADFFVGALSDAGFGAGIPGEADAVLLDIDHSPRHVLDPSHAALYTPQGLAQLARRLRPGGVFALWSDDPPDTAFTGLLGAVSDDVTAHVVRFPNPYTGGESANTVYVARARR